MKIFFIGYRCTGKTTIGRILADCLKFDFLDTDRQIEKNTRLSILQIVDKYGWEKFRSLEKEVLLNTKDYKNIVIATGGGMIIDRENQKFIKENGFCIWLYADIATILSRLKNDPGTLKSRPLLTNKELILGTHELIEERKPLYEQASHMRIDTSLYTPEKIVNIINRRLSNVRAE